MTLYLQHIDTLADVRDDLTRHRIAITIADLAGDLVCTLERSDDDDTRHSLRLAIAELDNIAKLLASAWYGDGDYDEVNEFETDRLLRLTAYGATVN
jgi:hypothetical protein